MTCNMTLREIFKAEKVDLDKLLDSPVGGPVFVVGYPMVSDVHYERGQIRIEIVIP